MTQNENQNKEIKQGEKAPENEPKKADLKSNKKSFVNTLKGKVCSLKEAIISFINKAFKREGKGTKTKENVFAKIFDKQEGSIVDNIVKQKAKAEEEKKTLERQMEEDEKKQKQAKMRSIYGSILHQEGEEGEERGVVDPQIKRLAGACKFIAALGVCLFLISFIAMDEQNRALGLFGVRNIGEELVIKMNEKLALEEKIKDVNQQIKKIEANLAITKVQEIIKSTKEKRVVWSDLLKEIESVIASVPQDFLDDVLYQGFTGDASEAKMSINTNLKNERVFTLNANLVDALSEHDRFYDINFSKYSKSKYQDNEDPNNRDFTARAKIDFKFNNKEPNKEKLKAAAAQKN